MARGGSTAPAAPRVMPALFERANEHDREHQSEDDAHDHRVVAHEGLQIARRERRGHLTG